MPGLQILFIWREPDLKYQGEVLDLESVRVVAVCVNEEVPHKGKEPALEFLAICHAREATRCWATIQPAKSKQSPAEWRPRIAEAVAPAAIAMTSQGTAAGRFQRAIVRGHVQAAEMAAREMGGLSLADALLLCELLANTDPQRYERAALRWLERFMEERLPPLSEVALAASALAELRHGHRNAGVETLKRLLRHG